MVRCPTRSPTTRRDARHGACAPGRPPNPGNISRDPNAELKGLTVSSVEEWKPGQDTQAVATARVRNRTRTRSTAPRGESSATWVTASVTRGCRRRSRRSRPSCAAESSAPISRCGSSRPTSRAASPTASAMARRDALLADRPRDSQRRRVPPPGRQRRPRRHRRRRLRQATGRNACRDPRTQRPRGDHVRRLDPARHRLPYRRADRHHLLLQAAAESPEERRRIALGGLARPRQLRRNVHLQHHAVVHRHLRHGAPAHGESRVGGSPAIEEFPAQLLDALQTLFARTIRPRDIVTLARCAMPRWWRSPWVVRPTSCSTHPS